jgi:endonuclease-3
MSSCKGIEEVISTLQGRYQRTILGTYSQQRRHPFQILIGAILSARTRDELTDKVCQGLLSRYPTPRALAQADPADIKRLIQPLGFYRQKARYIQETARIITRRYKGKVPADFEGLLELPGVGPKVANCVLVYAFGRDAIPVDTHVHRLSNRLGWVNTQTPQQTEKALRGLVPRQFWLLLNELFVAHGKEVCLPRRPRCKMCPIGRYCDTEAR